MCETDDDCGDGFVCERGAAGGFLLFEELTCTPTCSTDDDCPFVAGDCADDCNLVSCIDGHCNEATCEG